MKEMLMGSEKEEDEVFEDEGKEIDIERLL